MSAELQIDGDRLWSRLNEMARLGATPAGGCNRQALTDEDRAGRNLFISWCEQAGCDVRIDAIGNIFARRHGRNNDLPAVLTGSHLDTQPTGGKYDGVIGVLAGLEVLESLNDHELETEHPLEVVVWTNEEGSRFDYAMMGSAVWSGVLDLEAAYKLADRSGQRVGDELARIGFKGNSQTAGTPKAAFELHIEQGPILEAAGKQIGIVTGVQHMCRYHVRIRGQESHAGTTPMDRRRDPVMALAEILPALYGASSEFDPDSRLTIGWLNAEPGSGNTIPGLLEFTIDMRHPDDACYRELGQQIQQCCSEAFARYQLQGEVDMIWEAPGVTFDQDCIGWVERAAATLQYDAMQLISGAGHDSVNVSKVAPTSMIFVPCQDGLSHNEQESITPAQATEGSNVLLHAMLGAAGGN